MSADPTPDNPATAPLPAQAAAAPLSTGLSLLAPLGLVLLSLVIVAIAALLGLRWLLFDPAGSQWLVQRLPGVQVQGFQGALLGSQWQLQRLHVSWAGGEESITIDELSSTGMRWSWLPNPNAWAALEIDQLTLEKLTLRTGKPGARPIVMPSSLALPVQLLLKQARVGQLIVDELAPLRALALQGLVLEARPGAEHRIEQLQLTWEDIQLQAQARIASRSPQSVTLQANLRPSGDSDAPAWAAVLSAKGPLSELGLSATLRGVPLPSREAPAVDLRATLRPLLAWPLAELNLATRELDLSAITAKAPATLITAQVGLKARAKDAPLVALIELDNAAPGRWDEGRLPLRRLVAELRGELKQPGRLEAHDFDMRLADKAGDAGHLQGKAVWNGNELQIDALLKGLAPQRLDSRATAMQLTGPVTLTLRGLPSPDPAAKGKPPAPSMNWNLALEGQLDGAPTPVQLTMQGQATDRRLELTQFRASAGGARAELRAVMQRAGKSDWQLETTGSLVDFDPLPWWPGAAGSVWRQGPHRLSSTWQFDLRAPAEAAGLPTLELLQRLVGNGTLRLHDSQIAGVPLSADIRLGYSQAAAPTSASLRAEVLVGGNRISLEGRANPAGTGQADSWRGEVKAEALAGLAPLTRLHPALADWVPSKGSVTATLSADGRWPQMSSEGSAQVSQLQAGRLTLALGQLGWRMESGTDKAISLKLDLAGLQLDQQRADHLRAEVTGTLAQHRIDINGALPLQPPAQLVKLLGVQAHSGTRALLQVEGSWKGEAAGGGNWRARVERLTLGAWDGSAGDTPPLSVWAQARDLAAEVQIDGSGRLMRLRAEPGRLQLANTAALRWDEVQIDLRGARPQFELRADIEPFALVPLLARMQPAFGWAGDLKLGARIDIRAKERLSADLVFERREGDLHVARAEGVQLLGLTELRLSVAARDGNWRFMPVFKGRSLGEITGEVRVQTAPEQRWPDAKAALQGSIQARVADIGIWSPWVPPGWRLAGEASTLLNLSGKVGDPRYTGEVTGRRLAVRNLLAGVNVSDGLVTLRLDGDKAHIESFSLRGGDGSLSISGEASLAAPAQARLLIKADRFRLIGRVDRMAIASGQAELLLSANQSRLEGKFRLDEGLYDAGRSDAPSLDDDVTLRRAGEVAPVTDDKAAPAVRHNFVLALDIDLGEKLRVRGRGLETGLHGKLRLTTPAGRLDVRGSIRTEGGTYAAYGQKLTLERGVITFVGPGDDPRLDILALRPKIDTRVGVAISGTVSTPRVRLYSDPDMSDTDKLSWLVLGRAPDGLGRSDTALLQRAAMALLAGEGEAPTDGLLRNLGIDELSLRQSDGGTRETVVTLGKQLSTRWYLGYERGVNATAGTWQLIYRIAQRFTVRAQSGLENSIDMIWTWRVQETPADAAMRKSTIVPP